MSNLLHTPIEYLKGVGPKKGEALKKELNIYKYEDLLNYFPFRYVDRTIIHKVKDIPHIEGYVQLKGKITSIKETGKGRGKRLTAIFRDETGTIELIWFTGASWLIKTLKLNTPYKLYGKAKQFGLKWNISHPELEEIITNMPLETGLQSVYHSTDKLTKSYLHSKGIEKIIKNLLPQIKGQLPENLPDWIIRDLNLMCREEAIKAIHSPKNFDEAKKAQVRVKFEELFFLQLELLIRKQITQRRIKGYNFEQIGIFFNEFYENHLPFNLTNAQKKVLKEIRKDMQGGMHMNRLLQGDVGSGKTLVALMSMLIALGNDYQACLMAPTEILANQHYVTICEFLKQMNVEVALLTGSTRKKDRRILHEKLRSGEIHILIGTHALLEDEVKFKNLGLSVIDEQHRFGVAQRSKMWKKNDLPPHVLVMTATPIPRTLALTFYGDLDVSVIDELPPGRKTIQTRHYFEGSRLKVFKFIETEINKGRQVYIVYPLIKESEKMDYANLMDGYESILRRFPRPKYNVSIVHGQMKSEAKDFEMKLFAEGNTNIMVATTVIEVGVNVPNASIMIIESAEKFGLSQLHQLRGRVGRGAEQSYCILMTGNKLSADAKYRMETMVRTSDGFEISEADLKLRGPGDIMGTQQSGILNLKLADLAKDGQLVTLAREKARELLEKDSKFTEPQHQKIAIQLKKILQSKPNWSRIS
ncbi:MAG TPA: ATP-dependent DNA helicase RecG [Crocinitomix sp.]|nr:ATP-dependent DNA helicase RecG [Crocinitomix sp.]